MNIELFGTPGAGKTMLLVGKRVAVRDDGEGSFQCLLGKLLVDGYVVDTSLLDDDTVYLWLDTPIETTISRNADRDGSSACFGKHVWKGIPVAHKKVSTKECQTAFHNLARQTFIFLRAQGYKAYRIDGKAALCAQREYMWNAISPLRLLEYGEYRQQSDSICEKTLQDKKATHWASAKLRWPYHALAQRALNKLEIYSPKDVLEVGSCGVNIVKYSDSIDYTGDIRWTGFVPDVEHDIRKLPWPVYDKQYHVAVALRVFHHLKPVQKEAFIEMMRVADYVCVLCPEAGKGGINRSLFMECAESEPAVTVDTPFGPLLLFKSR